MRNRNKYGNKKVTVDGITFDSMKEAKRYAELKLLLRANEISDLKLQVPFVLFPKSQYGRVMKYIADFVYSDKNGQRIVEDVKGFKTDVYKLKKRLLAEIYGVVIAEV